MDEKLKAKKDALMAMRNKAMKSRMDDTLNNFKGMKKVSVISDSEEGLKKGLEKAEDILEGEDMDEEECSLAEKIKKMKLKQ